MHPFEDRPAQGQGSAGTQMWCEDAPIAAIADAVGTPVYVYSTAGLEGQVGAFREAMRALDPLIAYAVKANGSLAVLRTLARAGAGADTVSEGEVRRALAAGVPPQRIVFSGVGKTDAELAFALDVHVSEINIESEAELERLEAVAADRGARPAIAIRVNPDVGAGGHAKIMTGQSDSKFGVSLSEAERLYARAHASPHLRPVGVACHIGSQIADLAPLEAAARAMRALVERLRAQGLPVERLDLGGGLGVPYGDGRQPPSPAAYGEMLERVLAGLDITFAFEPGRLIAAEAGVLVSRVIHVHARPAQGAEAGRNFLVLDAAMNDLVRPAMYDAHHEIRPILTPADAPAMTAYDVVGPVCETGDTFTRDRVLPELAAGDLVAFMTAGAYGSAMASEYNSRPLVPEVLVNGDRWSVTRPRPTYEEMLARERMPDWLA